MLFDKLLKESSVDVEENRKTVKWVITVFLMTILISGTISLLSDAVMSGSSMVVAFLILLLIINIRQIRNTNNAEAK